MGFIGRVLVLSVLMFTGLYAFADGPTWADGILAWIANLSPGMIAGILGFIAEVVARVFPTAAPVSLLIPVKYAMLSVSVILKWIADLLDGFIASYQNLKK